MLRPLIAVLLAGVAFAACAEESENSGAQQEQPPPTPTAKGGCRPAPQVLVDALQGTLTGEGGTLRRVRYVAVGNPPSDPPLRGFREGVYVVSGEVASRGARQLLTWAISRGMLRTGGGAVLPIDSTTRDVSELGTAAGGGSPASLYTDRLQESAAYDRARACASGG